MDMQTTAFAMGQKTWVSAPVERQANSQMRNFRHPVCYPQPQFFHPRTRIFMQFLLHGYVELERVYKFEKWHTKIANEIMFSN
jgi:hypothetical protein